MKNKYTYPGIMSIQREQMARTEAELRYISANVESILDQLERKVVEENSRISFNKSPASQVFRGNDITREVNAIVASGLRPH